MDRNGVTLAGVNPPTNTASLGGGIRVEADNVTITGLDIGKTTGQTGVDDYAVYLASGASETTISYNVMDRGNSSGRAILTTFNGNNDNVTVMHNVIDNWTTGIFSQTTENMSIINNTITGNTAGSANDYTVGTSILYNIFKDNQEGIGVFTNGSDILTANFNNIYNNSVIGVKNYGGPTVDAENNWWGDTAPSDDVDGNVDFDPFETNQFSENS